MSNFRRIYVLPTTTLSSFQDLAGSPPSLLPPSLFFPHSPGSLNEGQPTLLLLAPAMGLWPVRVGGCCACIAELFLLEQGGEQ